MLSKIQASQIYLGDYGWHAVRFHFSFAEYCDPENISFGDLITFNDFTLQPGSGFEEHSHKEIEIVSYCVNGELVHEDNMGNKEILKRMEYSRSPAARFIWPAWKVHLTSTMLLLKLVMRSKYGMKWL
jgi:redox-sensitive bicupin YhaK (pirin superfamily)